MEYKTEIWVRKILSIPLWFIRTSTKKMLLKLNMRKVSFCKECGIDIRDFDVPDKDWARVAKFARGKSTLCWNCYCDYEYLSRLDFKK